MIIDENGDTSLHKYFYYKYFNINEIYNLSKYTNLNLKNKFGNTPLHSYMINCKNVRYDIIKILATDKNINIKNIDGKVPIHYYDFSNVNVIILEILVSEKNNNIINCSNMFSLVYYIHSNRKTDLPFLNYFLTKKNVNFESSYGQYPIHLYLYFNKQFENINIIKLLLTEENINKIDMFGVSPENIIEKKNSL